MEEWELPSTYGLDLANREWLLHLLYSCKKESRDKLILVLWRSWYVRNQIMHDEPDHSVVGSVLFLRSYYASLSSVSKQAGKADVKGKKPVQA